MPKIAYKHLSKQLDKHFSLLSWSVDNLKPGSNVRFKGSRSNRVRGQYRQILQIDYDSEMCYTLTGYDPIIGKFETDSLKTAIIVSKNTSKDIDPNYIGVVASNSLEYLQSVEINGTWTTITDIDFGPISRPKVAVYISPPGKSWYPIDQRQQIHI